VLIPVAIVIGAVFTAVLFVVLAFENDDPVRGNDVEFLVEHFD
jgi:hypothetical protein